MKRGEEFGRHALKTIGCPTLVVRGTRSDILDAETAAEMVSLLQNGRLAEVDAEHSVPQERPDEFAAAVLSFVVD